MARRATHGRRSKFGIFILKDTLWPGKITLDTATPGLEYTISIWVTGTITHNGVIGHVNSDKLYMYLHTENPASTPSPLSLINYKVVSLG